METLLKIDFTSHYGLPPSRATNFTGQTNSSYFELIDDQTIIYTTEGQGIARYKNLQNYEISVINFDLFLKSLPSLFLQNRKNCDLLAYSEENLYFLLNELSDTIPQNVMPYTNNQGEAKIGKRAHATLQLLQTLTDLMSVVGIKDFIDEFTVKQCCFFNKQATSPLLITATTAFNRINTITTSGFKMSNLQIESFGFELFEYSGNQIYTL